MDAKILIIFAAAASLIAYIGALATFGGSYVTTTIPTTISYPKDSQVQILSVQPSNISVGTPLNFNLTFKNIGNRTIYYVPFCGGYSLRATVSPAGYVSGSSVCIQLCMRPVDVPQGNSVTVLSANCGGLGKILHAGSAVANLTFRYYLNNSYSNPRSINFTYQLTFR